MFFKHNLPAFIWATVIFILCSMPGRSIPHVSWLELLSFDKFVHAGIFFVLQILCMRGFLFQHRFGILKKHFQLIPFILGASYGGLLEVMQSYCFSERSGDLFDFIANSFGCLLGAILYRKLAVHVRFLSQSNSL